MLFRQRAYERARLLQGCAQLGRSLLENSRHPKAVNQMEGTWRRLESRLQAGFSSLRLLSSARSLKGGEIPGRGRGFSQGVGSTADTGKGISRGPQHVQGQGPRKQTGLSWTGNANGGPQILGGNRPGRCWKPQTFVSKGEWRFIATDHLLSTYPNGPIVSRDAPCSKSRSDRTV